MAAIACIAALVSAYAVVWLGGAVEVLTFDDDVRGRGCIHVSSWSAVTIGTEVDRWTTGGLGFRPGVVCAELSGAAQLSPDDLAPRSLSLLTSDGTVDDAARTGAVQRQLSTADVVSTLFAILTGAVVGTVTFEELRHRRKEQQWAAERSEGLVSGSR